MFDVLPSRIVLAILAFFGFQCLYLIRYNLSVITIAMISSGNETCRGEYEEYYNETNIRCTAISSEASAVDWNEQEIGFVSGSFFYGYACTQIIGGRLAEMYGSKIIFSSAVTVPAILSMLLPVASKYNVWAAATVRIFQGLFQGMSFPAMHAMITKWIPPLERSRFVGTIYLASSLSLVITMPVCALIIDELSWEAAFYITGSIPIIWAIFWRFLIYDTPKDHPRITRTELRHIESTTSTSGTSQDKDKLPPIPWRQMMTNLPFIAIIICDIGNSYGLSLQTTLLPLYFNDKFRFGIGQVAMISSLPFLFRYLGGVCFSFLADKLISTSKLSIAATRKFFSVIAMFGPALIIFFVPFAQSATENVSLFCLMNFFNGAIAGSQLVNHTDISPNFSGTLFGISNTFGSITSFLSPVIAGAILHSQQNVNQWRWVFWACVPVYVVPEIFYLLFMSGTLQKWNLINSEAVTNQQLL